MLALPGTWLEQTGKILRIEDCLILSLKIQKTTDVKEKQKWIRNIFAVTS